MVPKMIILLYMSIVNNLIMTQFHIKQSISIDPKDIYSVIMRLTCTKIMIEAYMTLWLSHSPVKWGLRGLSQAVLRSRLLKYR